MTEITIYTFDGTASEGATVISDPVTNPGGGYPAELASLLVAEDPTVWSWYPVEYEPNAFLDKLSPVGTAIQRGVDLATEHILETPGKIVLSGLSQGSLVSGTLYNEFRYGNLQSRRSDLIAVINFGDGLRPPGWTIPLLGAIDPGGAGAATAPMRQSYGWSSGLIRDPEDLYWAFTNPRDAASCAPAAVRDLTGKIARHAFYSTSASPDQLIFLYGPDGTPNGFPSTLDLGVLLRWIGDTEAEAKRAGTWAGESLLGMMLRELTRTPFGIGFFTQLLPLLVQWLPFAASEDLFAMFGMEATLLDITALNPHAKYSRPFPYGGIKNSKDTAVQLAFKHLRAMGKRYLPSASPVTNPTYTKPYQLYTFGPVGTLYSTTAVQEGQWPIRTTLGEDNETVDFGKRHLNPQQTGFGASVAALANPAKVEWVPVSYSSAVFPLSQAIESAVDRAVALILAAPANTKFFLAGQGVGAAVTTALREEFATGRLVSRQSKLLRVYNCGNPVREGGVFQGDRRSLGAGLGGNYQSGLRATTRGNRTAVVQPSSPAAPVWEFANPADPIAVQIAERGGSQIWQAMLYNVYDPDPSLVADRRIQQCGFNFVRSVLMNLFSTTGAHNAYQSFYPFRAQPTKNPIQLSADNINQLAL